MKKVFGILFNSWKGVLINLGVILLLAYLLMHYFFNVKLHNDTLHNQHIKVPNLENLSLEEAESSLSEIGLQAVVNEHTFSENHKLHAVVNQVPKPNSEVKEGRKIFLTINADEEPTVTITEELYTRVHNTDVKNLIKLLEANHLKYGIRKDTLCSYDGYIFRLEQNGKEIKVGDELKRGSKVNALIGKLRSPSQQITGDTISE